MAVQSADGGSAHGAGAATGRLAHFPVAFFSTVMGLSGLTLVWQKAHEVFAAPASVATAVGGFAALAFVLLAVFYAAKILLRPAAVAEEYRHPVKLHFMPTISISLILLSIVALAQVPAIARPLFLVGTSLHLVLTLVVLHNWFNKTHFETAHLNPAWFIPIVGNVLVPIGGVPLGYQEPAWFFFSIGMVFWLVLFTIITNRVLFHHPLPERLAPTLFILIAPPAVGFLSYLKLTGGEIDAFARVLFSFALFLTVFLLTQAPRLMRARFFLSWWAYSFPLAAMTIAAQVMAERIGGAGFNAIAVAMLVIVSVVITGLVLRTLVAIARDEICVPE